MTFEVALLSSSSIVFICGTKLAKLTAMLVLILSVYCTYNIILHASNQLGQLWGDL